MLGALRLFKAFRIHNSTENQYHFDPKLLIFGSRTFQPTETKGIVSQEDFDSLRAQMISAGGSDLSMVKCLLILMCLAFPVGVIAFIARIALLIAHVSLPSYITIILVAVMIVPSILLSFLFNRYSKNAYSSIQEMLNKKNKSEFASKGVTLEIAASLKYMTITFHRTNCKIEGETVHMNPHNMA
jgi:membrane protein implicated in regulation of membrane protease activity